MTDKVGFLADEFAGALPPFGTTFVGFEVLESDEGRPTRLRLDFGDVPDHAPRTVTVTHSLIIEAACDAPRPYPGLPIAEPYFTLKKSNDFPTLTRLAKLAT
jgi:hypothetical protein